MQALGVSQPTAYRVISQTPSVHRVGKGRAASYVLERSIDGVSTPIPIYQIGEHGNQQFVGELIPVSTAGFYFRSHSSWRNIVADDLPFFLQDLRPSGFLGHLLYHRFPELKLPRRADDWSSSDTLRYLSRYGTNLPGNLIVGRDALQKARNESLLWADLSHSPEQYPHFASKHLEATSGGSSLGGDQPKFLSFRDGQQFIVKYSPPRDQPVGKRWGDILIAEFHALNVLRESGISATEASIYVIKNQVFLEVRRFDRAISGGRRGVISLAALEAEFLGMLPASWPTLCRALEQKTFFKKNSEQNRNYSPSQLIQTVELIDLFGRCIGNTDMHTGNISFLHDNLTITALAPIYDMTCMVFAPIAHQLVPVTWSPPRLLPEEQKTGEKALAMAHQFWELVAGDTRVSSMFRREARRCAREIGGR